MNREETRPSRDNLLKRLRRIEGQVKGIQKMIQEEKDCIEILTQVAAIRSAMNKVGSLILENHTMSCIENAVSCEDRQKAMNELARSMRSFVKFID